MLYLIGGIRLKSLKFSTLDLPCLGLRASRAVSLTVVVFVFSVGRRLQVQACRLGGLLSNTTKVQYELRH